MSCASSTTAKSKGGDLLDAMAPASLVNISETVVMPLDAISARSCENGPESDALLFLEHRLSSQPQHVAVRVPQNGLRPLAASLAAGRKLARRSSPRSKRPGSNSSRRMAVAQACGSERAQRALRKSHGKSTRSRTKFLPCRRQRSPAQKPA